MEIPSIAKKIAHRIRWAVREVKVPYSVHGERVNCNVRL